jgi:hypothetical protein
MRSHAPTGQLPSKQTNHNYLWALVLKPLKECSTPQAWGYCRVSIYQGTKQMVKYDTLHIC